MPIKRTEYLDDRKEESVSPKKSIKDFEDEELIEELESRGYVLSYWR